MVGCTSISAPPSSAGGTDSSPRTPALPSSVRGAPSPADTSGANTINSIQFDVADREAALSEARKLAVANGEKQAEELATAAGVQLGQVLSINSSSPSAPVPMYDYKFGVGGAAAAEAAVPVSTGQLIITLDVYMSYEIQ